MTLTLILLAAVITGLCIGGITANIGANAQENLQKYAVTQGSNHFEVMASMPGKGKIESIQVFPEYGSLYLSINADPGVGEGVLQIVLPRALIEQKTEQGTDTPFLVLVDGDEVKIQEINSTQSQRELAIPIQPDTSEVEIFGSQVSPEFNSGIVPAIFILGSTTFVILVYRFNLFKGYRNCDAGNRV